jgi:hypothetical protein
MRLAELTLKKQKQEKDIKGSSPVKPEEPPESMINPENQ